MRPLATWAVIGALTLIALFAARDALRSEETPASRPPATTTLTGQRRAPRAAPPRIAAHERLANELGALGTEGVLYLTDADCRRFLLGLPELRWTPQGLPGPVCPDATPDAVDERFGLEASQVDADIIEVRASDWRLRFEGNDPTFTPEGRLTFIRSGRLWEWTVRCPPAAEKTVFRGFRALSRCPRPFDRTPDRLREVAWLNDHDFAAVAGGDSYSTLLVVRNGRVETIFRAIGARMGALEASPQGRYVAVRIEGDLVVFDVRTRRPALLPPGADGPLYAIAWSPDDRFAVIASAFAVHVYPLEKPWRGVTVPVAAVGVEWR